MMQLRERKKQETRQRISDVATELFFARGFDAVTVEDVANAANVSKMTVFNYFLHKEELILDRDDDLKLLPFRNAICERAKGQSAVDALRGLVLELSAQRHPLCHINAQTVRWWRVVDASPSLRSRLHELADEAVDAIAIALAGPKPGGRMRLAAGMIVLTLRTAREESIASSGRGATMKNANLAFLTLMEQGFLAIERLLATAPPSGSQSFNVS